MACYHRSRRPQYFFHYRFSFGFTVYHIFLCRCSAFDSCLFRALDQGIINVSPNNDTLACIVSFLVRRSLLFYNRIPQILFIRRPLFFDLFLGIYDQGRLLISTLYFRELASGTMHTRKIPCSIFIGSAFSFYLHLWPFVTAILFNAVLIWF